MGFTDILHRHVNQLLIQLKHRGITLRHLAFGFGILVFLWTSWFAFFARRVDSLDLPRDAYLHPDADPTKEEWHNRAEQVKAAFVHTWRGYEEQAWGYDEIKPVTGVPVTNFNGWGVSIVDAMDTIFIMNLHDEFKRALSFVEKATWDVPAGYYAPFFETTIRYLGGLLSAYALSGEPILLDRADALGRLMEPAFLTPSKFPVFAAQHKGGVIATIAEMATCQMEYLYLAKATNKKEFFDIASYLANNVNKNLYNASLDQFGGMLPIRWNLNTTETADSTLSVGAMADSAHEYLLKQYLMTAKTDKKSLELYIQTTTMILTQLFYITPTRHLVYVTDTASQKFVPSHTFEHLSCFLPGLLALGVHTLPLDNLARMGIDLDELSRNYSPEAREGYAKLKHFNLKELHMWAAESLAQTCYMTYADQPSGLGPDEVVMFTSPEPTKQMMHPTRGGGEKWLDTLLKWKKSGSRGTPPGLAMGTPVIHTYQDRKNGPSQGTGLRDYTLKRTGYLLRPETLESLYLLWRITGDSRWRRYGWDIFEAIEDETKTIYGYTSLNNVQLSPASVLNQQPRLKYLYLMFAEEDIIPLDKYVFNTEGHPFPVFEWTGQQRREWGAP
ncbi:hypothetical protein HWV62_3186 [Athelia sp. TMB]|nr:hypothetical protein HWV62_3186 [Athelia sp. TMB]